MAIINEIIGPQNLELVATSIAQILKLEIQNQIELQDFKEKVDVYLERMEPFDKAEDVMISVAYREGTFEEHTQMGSQGQNLYFIDLFTSAYGTSLKKPSILAKEKLFKYLGIVRYVLSSSKYATLGFPKGFIGGKYIKKITLDTDYSNFGNHSNYDWAYIRFARVIFYVRVQEYQDLSVGRQLLGNDTKINYVENEKGLLLTFNN